MSQHSLSVARVFLQIGQQPPNTLLVIFVLLALHDDLLPPVYKLVSPFFREILFSKEGFGPVIMFVRFVLVLLRYTVSELVLEGALYSV